MSEDLSRADVEDILLGAAVLGGGGGGDLEEGFALLDLAEAAGKRFRMARLDEVPGEALICTPYLLGAVSDLPQAEEALIGGTKPPILAAYERLCAHLDTPVFGAVPCELGGSNTAVPFYVAAMAGAVVIDADPAGRAVPEITHSAYALAGLPVGLIVTANALGETCILEGVASDARAEELVRGLAQMARNDIAAIDHTLPANVLRKGLLEGTLSRSRRLGEILRAGRSDPAGAPARIAEASGGAVIFEGKVTKRRHTTQDGFTVGQFELSGLGRFAEQSFAVDLKNENMVGRLNGVPVVTIPEIISAMDMETGEVVTNPNVRISQHLVIVVLPAPSVFLTGPGLESFGPRYAGLDIPFRSAIPQGRNEAL